MKMNLKKYLHLIEPQVCLNLVIDFHHHSPSPPEKNCVIDFKILFYFQFSYFYDTLRVNIFVITF